MICLGYHQSSPDSRLIKSGTAVAQAEQKGRWEAGIKCLKDWTRLVFEDKKALEFELRGRASLLSITPSVTQVCPASYPTPSTVPPRSPGTASMLPNPFSITAQAEKGTPGYQLGSSSLHDTISKADTKDHILVRMLLSFPTRPIRGPRPM